MKLPKVAFHPVDPSLIPEDTKKLPRAARRLMDIILKGSTESLDSCSKSWSLDFCLSPKSFEGGPGASTSRVNATTFERTTLSSPFDHSAYASGTGEVIQLPSSVVFRSIGYKSVALDGFSEMGVPFDERRGIIQNNDGRVRREVRTIDGAMTTSNSPGLYCAGWVKRGPTGVIASTMIDAFATADAIAQDWESRTPFLHQATEELMPRGWEGVRSEIRPDNARIVQWAEWQKIDKAERERGLAAGKEREKFTSTAEMLAVAG